MDLNKTQVVLYMYEKLEKNGYLYPEEVKKQFDLERKTFFRYILEIRVYLYNFYTGKELVYSRHDRRYYLTCYEKD